MSDIIQSRMGLDCMSSMQAPTQFAKYVEPGCPYRADDVMQAEEAVKTGTTIMSVKYNGGVVMGADTRTSTGQYVANRASRKISKVHDKIFVCRCGSAADTQALTGYVQNYLTQHATEIGGPPTVQTAANLFRLIAYNSKDNLMAGFIIAGYDEKRGGQVFSIPLGGTLNSVSYAMDGSGSGYVGGLVDEYFRPEMTKDEALAFVTKCISHAMARDGSSGGMIRTLVVNADGLEENVIPGNKLPYGP